ncbi:MAG TPA: energy-coupling factor transporter ATPase [Ktedonobacter sp.]|nr:energy-coupling factor transporter ATPase [Ktedonobacter sp.]HAT45652.1 energy-coupling factor transporter ATPase [Ktedonobacter sp.]HBE25215.1 energy-coupling factor transporter ATPase [Ktedonobacter sp.]HCF85816.1 energy-coupling factor transporter ATPase [Ktedonobacter sp.]HCP73191.1 energy-coupling factor transporter ATPase [Ktedonobacter sp.]
MISVKNLYHTYQSGPLQKAALIDISMEIERGSCSAIIGITGSGKSTLVQHFNGLLRPTSGSLIVDGVNVKARGGDLKALRQRVGMLFQFPEAQLFEHTIYADVAFGPRRLNLPKSEVRTRVLHALDAVGLPPRTYAQRSPFELSGGQRRRAALAGVLAMSPKILVLDEPTAGLDADGRAEFYYYLQHIQQKEGVTIILVSHDMSEVATLADQLFVLYNGRLVAQGTPRTIFGQGQTLHQWGLTETPLGELLILLRKQGVALPSDVFTFEEALNALQALDMARHEKKNV